MTVGSGVLLVVGVLEMLTGIALLGLSGIVLFAVGATLLAFGVGNRVPKAVQILAALLVVFLAAIPWLLPWFDSRVLPGCATRPSLHGWPRVHLAAAPAPRPPAAGDDPGGLAQDEESSEEAARHPVCRLLVIVG